MRCLLPALPCAFLSLVSMDYDNLLREPSIFMIIFLWLLVHAKYFHMHFLNFKTTDYFFCFLLSSWIFKYLHILYGNNMYFQMFTHFV